MPENLPTFSTVQTGSSPLSLLASVATSHLAHSDLPGAPTTGPTLVGHNLYNKGPYNPAALLPPRLVKRILDLEYVEMSDISPDDTPAPLTGHPPPPPKKPIQDISRWVEKFATMAAVLTARFPEKAPEMFAYLTSIVKAERNFEGSRWVAYDRCYRREALASKSLDWSLPNTRLYNEAFTGHAKALPRCTYCLQEDHMAAACPRNPARAWLPWLPDHIAPHQPHPPSQERCNRYNEGRCRNTANTCKYIHKCRETSDSVRPLRVV